MTGSPFPGDGIVRILLSAVLLMFASGTMADWYSDSRDIMGTRISASLWHEDGAQAQAALAAVMAEFQRLDDLLSPYKPDSEVSRLNRLATNGPQPLSAEMLTLLDKSLYYSRLSNGAFDISFASLGRYYDYRKQKQPSESLRRQLQTAIDYRRIHLDRERATVAFGHPQLQIDLGGIAKGYAVDRAVDILRRRGITHATVSAGGDSRVVGDKRGQPWLVGVKNPRRKEKVSVLLPLIDVAVSTSGDYERYFIDQSTGARVHHILNPGTGRAASDVMSVTILGAAGFDTDPLSTTVFVLGLEKGMQLLARLPGFDGVIIDADGKVHYSPGLAPPATR